MCIHALMMGIRLHHRKYLGISMLYKISIHTYLKEVLNQGLNLSLQPWLHRSCVSHRKWHRISHLSNLGLCRFFKHPQADLLTWWWRWTASQSLLHRTGLKRCRSVNFCPKASLSLVRSVLSVNLSQRRSAVTAIICNSYPLKILFVACILFASMTKMMTAVRAPCAALLTRKRQCLPLSRAVFSQSVKKVRVPLPGE